MNGKKTYIVVTGLLILAIIIGIVIGTQYQKHKIITDSETKIKNSISRALESANLYKESKDISDLDGIMCELYASYILYKTDGIENKVERVDLETLWKTFGILETIKSDLQGTDEMRKGLELLNTDIYCSDGFSYLETFIRKNIK
ncbi:MAG: hypothetical protein Q4F05_05285 [bacterium]|nr:hypothetical protein [bacterium]